MTAKLGGVMNAAKALRIAQPSLSAQIRTLEGELNLKLFQKIGRRLALTPDGERAFGHCRKIFEAAEDFSDHLTQSDTSLTHRCRIGVTREIERPFIADILSTILRKKTEREQPMISMISDDHAKLVERIKIGELDTVVTNHPVYGNDISILAELQIPVIAVVAPRLHKKLAPRKNDSLAAIIKGEDIGFILPSESLKVRIETDLFLQKVKLRNRIVFESDILAAVVRAALEGVGVAFLPKAYIAREINHEALIPLGNDGGYWRHRIYLVARNTKTMEPTVREVRDHFIQLGAQSKAN